MKVVTHVNGEIKIAEVISEAVFLVNPSDGIDLLGNIYYSGFDALILHTKNIHRDFFDLKTGIAGEILQKFSNYRMRLAIVGEFANTNGRSLHDFIAESNKHGHVIFVATSEQALEFFKRM